MSASDLILLERLSSGVAVVKLNNPPLNLQTLPLVETLEKVIMDLSEDNSIRCIVLTGEGNRAFSAGSDVKEFPALRNVFVEGKLRRENAVFNRISDMPQPVVAALCGSAIGGGCELALCCDFRIIDEGAKIGLPEINLGSFPGSGGMVRLPKVVGPSIAMELMSLGSMLSAPEAQRLGLVDKIAPRGQALQEAISFAIDIANRPADIVQYIKRALRASVQINNGATLFMMLGDQIKVWKR